MQKERDERGSIVRLFFGDGLIKAAAIECRKIRTSASTSQSPSHIERGYAGKLPSLPTVFRGKTGAVGTGVAIEGDSVLVAGEPALVATEVLPLVTDDEGTTV